MRTLHKAIKHPSRSDNFILYHITDSHLGARACDEKLLRRDIQRIADDEHAYWIHGGDAIDCIARKGDKRYNEATLAKWLHGKDDAIGHQRDYAIDMFAPIAAKCLGIVEGNHERAALTYYDRNIYWEFVAGMARAANVEPQTLALGVQGFIVLHFQRGAEQSRHSTPFVIYSHHGYGGGRLPGGHALALGRVLSDYQCDLALLGHRHTMLALNKSFTSAGRKGALVKQRWAAFVPSYLRAFISPSDDKRPTDSYAEHIGLPPQSIGTFPIRVYPDQRRFELVLSSGAVVET